MTPTYQIEVLELSAQMGTLRGIAHREGRIVAVGGTYGPSVLTSSDGREFLQLQPELNVRPSLYAVCLLDDERVVASAEDGYIFISTDSGASWTTRKTGVKGRLYALVTDDTGRLWAAGDKGVILTSDDQGETWTLRREGGPRILGILPNGERLYFYGKSVLAYEAGEFANVPLHPKVWICDMVTTTRGTILAVGDEGTVFLGDPEGKKWKPVSVPAFYKNIDGAAVLDDGLAVLVGESGMVLVSHDHGESFQRVESGREEDLYAVCSYRGGALLAGRDGRILWFGAEGESSTFAETSPSSESAERGTQQPPHASTEEREIARDGSLFGSLRAMYESLSTSGTRAGCASDLYLLAEKMEGSVAQGEELSQLEAALQTIHQLFEFNEVFPEPGDEEYDALEMIQKACQARLPIPPLPELDSREVALRVLTQAEIILIGVQERGAITPLERQWMALVGPSIELFLDTSDPDEWYPSVLVADNVQRELECLAQAADDPTLKSVKESVFRLMERFA